ncbi:MAG: ABC transporter permease [Planctomycetes bacterium]|nr:ABC transporter permease [Planctomycetota bacterium]
MKLVANFGGRVLHGVEAFGDLCRFSGQAFRWLLEVVLNRRHLRLLLPQLYEIGTKSIPVVVITGAFIGAVLAVQTVAQFQQIGYTPAIGTIVNLSVLRELGPVLAGVMLAGRVGGGLTAELGTMRVTEQIDALRAMGADPIRVLVVPRLMACMLLIPILVVYADLMGIMGGYFVSTYVYSINSSEFWALSQKTVRYSDIFYGPFKSLFFGMAISLICCYKGFRCAPGAAGVGKACTESFVASCMAVIAMNFFLGMALNAFELFFLGTRSVL